MHTLLGSGAEATVYLDEDSSGSHKVVDKVRLKKNYRHIDIDSELRKTRTRKEAKILKSLEPYEFAPKIKEQKDIL